MVIIATRDGPFHYSEIAVQLHWHKIEGKYHVNAACALSPLFEVPLNVTVVTHQL